MSRPRTVPSSQAAPHVCPQSHTGRHPPPHFTDEETKAQTMQSVTCLRLQARIPSQPRVGTFCVHSPSNSPWRETEAQPPTDVRAPGGGPITRRLPQSPGRPSPAAPGAQGH